MKTSIMIGAFTLISGGLFAQQASVKSASNAQSATTWKSENQAIETKGAASAGLEAKAQTTVQNKGAQVAQQTTTTVYSQALRSKEILGEAADQTKSRIAVTLSGAAVTNIETAPQPGQNIHLQQTTQLKTQAMLKNTVEPVPTPSLNVVHATTAKTQNAATNIHSTLKTSAYSRAAKGGRIHHSSGAVVKTQPTAIRINSRTMTGVKLK